jgi:hypothetical protein
MWARIAASIGLWLAASGAADAVDLFVAASGGSDAGPCTEAAPCATLSHACATANQSPDRISNITVAPGQYVGDSCNVYYHHLVSVHGDCGAPRAVDIALRGSDAGFWAQDGAILTVQCVSVRSIGNGSIAVAARQFAIMDVNNAHVGPLPQGVAISAQEMSKINCGVTLTVGGPMNFVFAAGGRSTLSAGCAVTFESTPELTAVMWAAQGSLILAGLSYSGATSGQRFICDASQIEGVAALPGAGESALNGCLAR